MRQGDGIDMGAMSIWHWLVVGILVVLLFGRGKISELMGDVAKGIKSFKRGMAEDDPKVTETKDQIVTPELGRTKDSA